MSHPVDAFSRRTFLQTVPGAASFALTSTSAQTSSRPFPPSFLWGCATAAYQVEGNNVNSDLWVLENLKPTIFQEPSGDACDHYHRYREDIGTLRKLGFNAYRLSIEWARIEPEQGRFSLAELEHYRSVLGTCREAGVTPMVTYSHFTLPRWVAALGGWENPETVDHFTRYAEFASRHLGDLTGAACTFNEPNVVLLLGWMPSFMPKQALADIKSRAARAAGSERFGSFFFSEPAQSTANLLKAHRRAFDAIKSGPGKFPVGATLAIADDQPSGPDSARDRKRAEIYGPWLESARKDYYIGVQTYTRARVGAKSDLPPEKGAELTQTGWEFYPEALEATIRYAAAETRVPVYVTENGIATEDDTRRVEYVRRALAGVKRCIDSGLDVRGYFHWSLLDNWEWMFGFKPKFGLIAVNRETFERTVKPSGTFLGEIARRNGATA